jgi:hypothetical protein
MRFRHTLGLALALPTSTAGTLTCRSLLLLTALVGFLQVGLAQQLTSLTVGTRVRLKLGEGGPKTVEGDFVAHSDDSLRIEPVGADDTLAFAVRNITRLEVSRGWHSRAGHGAFLGAGIGVLAGLGLGAAASTEESSFCCAVGAGEIAGVSAMLGALGAGLGAAIGAASHGERWQEVPGFSGEADPRIPGRPAIPGADRAGSRTK